MLAGGSGVPKKRKNSRTLGGKKSKASVGSMRPLHAHIMDRWLWELSWIPYLAAGVSTTTTTQNLTPQPHANSSTTTLDAGGAVQQATLYFFLLQLPSGIARSRDRGGARSDDACWLETNTMIRIYRIVMNGTY